MADEEEEDEGEDGEESEESESSDEEYASKSSDSGHEGMPFTKSTKAHASREKAMSDLRSEMRAEASFNKSKDMAALAPEDATNLRRILRHKYGSTVRGWREVLDTHGVHKVMEKDFYNAMRKIGFPGDAVGLYTQLGGRRRRAEKKVVRAEKKVTKGPKGKPKTKIRFFQAVTLEDLDGPAEKNLRTFHDVFTRVFGPLAQYIEATPASRISKGIFLTQCAPLKSKDLHLESAFKDLQHHGFITVEDAVWLDAYCEKKPVPGLDPEKLREIRTQQQALDEIEAASRKRTVKEFKEHLQHKFGSIVAGWRLAILPPEDEPETDDEDEDSASIEPPTEVTFEQFKEAIEELGFGGKGAAARVSGIIWDEITGKTAVLAEGGDEMDDDEQVEIVREGTMSLEDLEPRLPKEVLSFKAHCKEHFGSVANAFRHIDAPQKPLVTRPEFKKLCLEVHFMNCFTLFEYLDTATVGAIILTQIDRVASEQAFGKDRCLDARDRHRILDPLPRKRPQPSIMERAKAMNSVEREIPFGQRQAFVDFLERKFGSPVRAWHAALDPKNRGKLSKAEFTVSCAVVGYCGCVSTLWKEMGLKPKGSVRLKDISPEVMEEVRRFKTCNMREIEAVFEDKHSNRAVHEEEFGALVRKTGFDDSHLPLFKHLDLDGQGHVQTQTLRWLNAAKSEDKALPSLLSKYKKTKSENWKQKLSYMVIPSTSDTISTQQEVIQEGRQRRSELQMGERELLAMKGFLGKKYGGVTRGWKLALDRADEGELTQHEFISGLVQAGFYKTSDTEFETKGKALFEHLDKEGEGVVTLAMLDPASVGALEALRRGCILRFGSVRAAFQIFDRKGEGKINKKDFTRLCHEALVPDMTRRLLDFLDPTRIGEVNFADIDADAAEVSAQANNTNEMDRAQLDDSEETDKQKHLAAGKKALAKLRLLLNRKFRSIPKPWLKVNGESDNIEREAFDTLCGLVKLTEYETTAAWQFAGIKEGDPYGEEMLERGATITMFNLEPGLEADLKELKGRIVERYGSMVFAIKEIDNSGTYKLGHQDFMKFCFECQFRRNEKRTFQYLCWASLRFAHEEDSSSDEEGSSGEDSVEDESSEEDGEKTKVIPEFIHLKSLDEQAVEEVIKSRKDHEFPQPIVTSTYRNSAEVFRNHLRQRFGTTWRAWSRLDNDNRGALTKQEFTSSLGAVGFGGSSSVLWHLLAGKYALDTVSFKELDPQEWETIENFRQACVDKFGKWKTVFHEEQTGKPTKVLTLDAFKELMREVKYKNTEWKKLFTTLDRSNTGKISWVDIRLLEKTAHRIEGGKATRFDNTRWKSTTRSSLASSRSMEKLGPLYTSMRPKKVELRHSASLPEIRRPLQPSWNDRHHISENKSNKSDNLLHMVSYVNTHVAERLRRDVREQIEETPTDQWYEEYLALQSGDY